MVNSWVPPQKKTRDSPHLRVSDKKKTSSTCFQLAEQNSLALKRGIAKGDPNHTVVVFVLPMQRRDKQFHHLFVPFRASNHFSLPFS